MRNSPYCYAHRHMTPELHKERWFKKYILGKNGPLYLHSWTRHKSRILRDLKNGSILLTKEDIQKIPVKFAYVDIYALLLQQGFAKYGDHPSLEWHALWLHTNILYNFPDNQHIYSHKDMVESTFILSSGQAFYRFLSFVAGTAKGRAKYGRKIWELIPTLLDTDAAKEMSWMSYDELDKLRLTYEKELGVDHTLTKCLVQRWLLDIKELYQTEKAIQKVKMDCCKEELMMNRWHPNRVERLLLAGIDPEDM